MNRLIMSIRNNGYFLKIALQNTPYYFLFAIILRIIRGLRTTFMNVYFLSFVVASVEGKRSLTDIFRFVLISFLLVSLTYLFQAFFDNIWKPVFQEKLTNRLQHIVFAKTARLDIQAYESEGFYTTVTIVNEECRERMVSVVESTLNLLEYFITLFSIIGYSFSIDFIVPFIGIISFLINYLLNKKLAELGITYKREMQRKNKEEAALHRILFLPEYAKDVRLTHIRDVIMTRYQILMQDKTKYIRESGGKISRITALKTILTASFCIDFLIPLYLTFCMLIWKTMSASGFLAILNGCSQLQLHLEVISDEFAVFYQNGAFIEYFRQFESLSQNIEVSYDLENSEKIPFQTLEMKDVCFEYANSSFGLTDINLRITKGEKIAVVGRNGSGKTTLIKLLLRLYDCSSGIIHYNGVPITDMNIRQYRSSFSTLFQDFCVYETSVAKNISLTEQPDKERVQSVLEKVDLLDEIPDPDMILGKEFSQNGSSMSGGQLQRLALARVLYEDHDILVMDEPTSAVDALFEKHFFKLIHEHLKEKTVFFVSHRLTSVISCDQILYMEKGRIMERGTHQELMTLNGGYARLFKAQSEAFE